MKEAGLRAENIDLRRRLAEAEEVILAIRSGAVDAFVVEDPLGHRVYTLDNADRPYRLLVEQMQQGAVTLSADGTIAYCNRRFADLLGAPHERMTGIAFRDFIAPSDFALYDGLLREVHTAAGQSEAHMRKSDGESIPVFLTFNALPPDCGVAVGVLVTDLTTQRHHEKLDAAVKALEESDRLKNEFLAMLAHELRNPLAPICNAVHIMRLTDGDATVHASTSEMMERQVSQMVRLVDDLLDVSRISCGKIELRREQIELASVIGHAVEASRSEMEISGHIFSVALPSRPMVMNGDSARLAQVVGNLLSNARKFTNQRGDIALTLEREGEHAVIRVRDNGIGIVAGKLPHIFEMFMQIDTSLERSISGLGIGLTLVKTLVQMHDGTVEAHSAGAGQGSEFVVRLPILAETHPLPSVPAVDQPLVAAARRILVVDDNRDSTESLTMLLQLTGHLTHAAYDGLEAVAAAANFKPDVILLDIGLPKLNGYEACRRIRELPSSKDMMLVALTGWGGEEDRKKSRDAGFDTHMVKPVDFVALTKLLSVTERVGA